MNVLESDTSEEEFIRESSESESSQFRDDSLDEVSSTRFVFLRISLSPLVSTFFSLIGNGRGLSSMKTTLLKL
jgi:hypothetical protein